MKKIIVALFVFIAAISAPEANAQISLSINIGKQPAWGPVGYDHVDFYYLPDINVYYDVARAQYVYPSGSQWVYGQNLPSRYNNFDLYNSYKVVVNEARPYLNNKVYAAKYAKYKGQHNQQIIRDSRDTKYYQSAQHPQHQQWEKQQASANVKSNNNYNQNNQGNKNTRNNNSKNNNQGRASQNDKRSNGRN
jgi:hypothetical protein